MAPTKRARRSDETPHQEREVVASFISSLPEGALFAIVESLAEVEPGGVRGPSLVARDICSLGMVSSICSTTQQHYV
jgi:hypothetical protein